MWEVACLLGSPEKAAAGGYLSFEIISGGLDSEPVKLPDGWADVLPVWVRTQSLGRIY